jgi:hypothetical protein
VATLKLMHGPHLEITGMDFGVIRLYRLPRLRTFIFQPDAPPGRAYVRSGRMKVELADTGRRREIAGEDSYSDRDSTTELSRSRGHIDGVPDLH